MKKIILMFLLVGISAPLKAAQDTAGGGPDSGFDVQPVFNSLGNTERDFGVPLTTSNWVLVSSAAVGATGVYTDTQPLNIDTWRAREIVNTSTCAALVVMSGSTPKFKTNISSFGVTLSSDSSGLGAGDAYDPPGQDAVWGRWTAASGNGSCAAGAGANVHESYYSDSKRR